MSGKILFVRVCLRLPSGDDDHTASKPKKERERNDRFDLDRLATLLNSSRM